MSEVSGLASLGPQILFWVLALAVVFRGGRVRLISYLCLVHLGVISRSLEPTITVGVGFAVKAFALPIVLLAKEGRGLLRPGPWRKLGFLWLALTGYAAIAIGWSPYRLAGLKMIVYLMSEGLLFLYFLKSWQEGIVDRRLILASLWAGLTLAVFQSYVLSNPFGTLEAGFAPRFTSFSSPQSFALFLLIHVGILFMFPKRDTSFWVSLLAAASAILLSGSRFVFLALCFLIVTILGVRGNQSEEKFRIRRVANLGSVLGVCTLLLLVQVARAIPGNRLQELIGSSEATETSYGDLINVGVRLAIYADAQDRIQRFSPATLVFGEGTSSAAEVKMDILNEYDPTNVDANRAMHNEFLRAFYEWGIIGFAIFVSVCALLTWRCVRVGWAFRKDAFVPCIGLLAGLWLSLLVENFLSDPGAPGGTAIAMFLGFVAMRDQGLQHGSGLAEGTK